MNFQWIDYDDSCAALADSWMDEDAVRNTGCDDGWNEFYEYWRTNRNPEDSLGDNFWCRVITDGGIPFGIIAVGMYDSLYTIMEYVVDPKRRGQGYGTLGLCELLKNSDSIIGKSINQAEAVIFPSNIAAQKMFEKAGFVFDHAHPDGDAYYYTYRR